MTQPLTRNLAATVDALAVAEAEVLFQADRIEKRIAATTENEREHLADLATGYRSAARYLRILINYQEGRLGLKGGGAGRRDAVLPESIDEHGRATAFHTEDGE